MHAAELQEGVPKVVTSSQGLGCSGGGLGGSPFWSDIFGGKCMENAWKITRVWTTKLIFCWEMCMGKGHEMLITADRCVINHLNLQNMTGSLWIVHSVLTILLNHKSCSNFIGTYTLYHYLQGVLLHLQVFIIYHHCTSNWDQWFLFH